MRYEDLFFEDYQVGEQGESCGRTITEADLLQFAAITGDFAPAHMDRQVMTRNKIGVRVSHGFFATCLAAGMLSYHAPHIVGRDTPAVGFWEIESRYTKPVLLEDTLRLRWHILEKAPDLCRAGFGTVKTAFRLVDQDNKTACEGVLTTKVRLRQAGEARLQYKPGQPFEFVESSPDFDKVYGLEDYVIGDGIESYGRVITETDVVNLMGLTQDYSRLYVDATYAKKTVYGTKIAPWLLVPAIAMVLACRDGFYLKIKRFSAPYIGHLGEKISFLAPARIGDVIRCKIRVEDTRVSRTKPDRGVVTFRQQAINQRDEALVEIQTTIMTPTRMAAAQFRDMMWVLSTTVKPQNRPPG